MFSESPNLLAIINTIHARVALVNELLSKIYRKRARNGKHPPINPTDSSSSAAIKGMKANHLDQNNRWRVYKRKTEMHLLSFARDRIYVGRLTDRRRGGLGLSRGRGARR